MPQSYFKKLKRIKSDCGFATLSYLLVSVMVLGLVMLLLEFYRIYTVKQNLDIELSRAVNIALDLSMMDIYRRDHELELDVGDAIDSFYSYLHNELKLDGNLINRDASGNEVFELVIDDLFIQGSPPVIRLRASILIKPTYFGNMYLSKIKFPVRAASHNRSLL